MKTISPSFLLRIIQKAKDILKKDEIMQNVFKEYDLSIKDIDLIPTYFKKLNVSAKTDHGIVYLNYKLLENGFDFHNLSYLIHEYSHYLQQTTGTKPTKSSNDGHYLDNKFEQEAFSNQIEYLADHKGDKEAEDYVENLLDHHEVDNKKEREDKKETLMAKV